MGVCNKCSNTEIFYNMTFKKKNRIKNKFFHIFQLRIRDYVLQRQIFKENSSSQFKLAIMKL